MRRKKNWAKIASTVLTVTVTLSSVGSMPAAVYAQGEDLAEEIYVEEENLAEDIDVEENVSEAVYVEGDNVPDAQEEITGQNAQTGLTDFTSKAGANQISVANGAVTLNNTNGDHFATYNDLAEKANDFVLEADVKLLEGPSAALIFGIENKTTPSTKWYGANVNTNDGGYRIFGVNANMQENKAFGKTIDISKTLHLKLDVKKNGEYTYSFGEKGATLETLTGTIPDWKGGYVGILTWNSKAEFSNISFENRTVQDGMKNITAGEQYQTNLDQMVAMTNADWNVTEEGLYSNAIGKGDSFLYSKTHGKNFVYSTDVTFKQNTGAASLIFRNSAGNNNKNCYVVNLNAETKKCRFWKWQNEAVYDLIDEKVIQPTEDNKYTLKVVAVDSWISYYVNDTLVASTGDYTIQYEDKGQGTCINEGYVGLLNWNGEMVFQNTYCKEINDDSSPLLTDISVTSTNGDVENKAKFFPTEPTMIQYVKNKADTVNVTATSSTGAIVTVSKDGIVYDKGEGIPVEVGSNYITVTSCIQVDKNTQAMLTYKVNVHRRQPDSVYYNEPYRDQYHYSVKDGWGNDPNGMIYYKGKYHFFHQFYDDTKWGPMHIAHATSTDMIHWEEKPIALYPDANGTMFNDCIVADTENTSGLFDGIDGGGLVALITVNGNGQRIKVAYSTDEGDTWTKVDKIAADWSDDPLHNRDFRDPKVFRWENKWFMVIAGGPLRIYSSDNLLDWKCESAYADLHTECPDLYPVRAEDGKLKWVLSGGGRFYKVGDFREENGSWTFIPDKDYSSYKSWESQYNGIMNFGKDSYAAMTYYVQDFGTVKNPTLPDIIEVNWMNTWDDYCRIVADKVGQQFNGTYNLTLKVGLEMEDGKYVLTQTPIEEYKTLRDTENAIEFKDVTVSTDNKLLDGFQGDCYEIVSTFKPTADTKKVGFKLRTGINEETAVVYDLESEILSLDRSKSGTIISNKFSEVDSQKVTKNEDGSVDLHIYVDRASVEVFSKGYTVAGAQQIFPSISSLGASVLVDGGEATANITIYPMNTIWENKVQITDETTPTGMTSPSADTSSINVGDAMDLSVFLMPVGVKQEINWSVNNNGIVSVDQDSNNKNLLHVTGLKKGTATITVSANAKPELKKEFTVNVYENNFKTNLAPFTANGNWFIDDETLSVSNTSANDFYMTENEMDSDEYVLETDLKYEKGLINIFFASNGTNPFGAYAVQFGGNSNLRLFRFAQDGDIAIANMNEPINDNQYHHVKIAKTKNCVTVFVDGTEYLTHTFDNVEAFYNQNTHVGLGLWDGALEVKGFYTEIVDAAAPRISEQPTDSTCKVGEKVTLKVTAESTDGGTLSYQWYSNTTNSTEGAKEISGANKDSYDVPTDTVGTTYYFCKVTNSNNHATGQSTACINSNTAKVTVTKISVPTISTNSNLSSLSISEGTLSPKFSAEKQTYKAVVENAVGSILVTPKTEDEKSTVTVNGKPASKRVNLKVGYNTIKVEVTAEDGKTTKVYTIQVTRAVPKNTTITISRRKYKVTNELLANGSVEITGLSDKKVINLSVPDTVKIYGITYKITSVGKNAFRGQPKMKTAKIGKNVTSIGYGAFYACPVLKSVTLGTKVKTIGNHAFCRDSKLRTLTLEGTALTKVENHVLYKAASLTIKAPSSKVKTYNKLFTNKGTKSFKVVKK